MTPFRAFVPVAGLLATGLFTVSLLAQADEPMTVIADGPNSGRSFVVVAQGATRIAQVQWRSSAPLFRYVHDHPAGSYVVFEQDGAMYRFDNPARMAEVQRLYAPMKALGAQQQGLGHAQKPLSRHQHTLSAEQRAATDPQEKGRIGQAQGALGQAQGDLGTLQGELGRQQGEVARAASLRLQTMFDQCLAEGTCARVGS